MLTLYAFSSVAALGMRNWVLPIILLISLYITDGKHNQSTKYFYPA